MGIVSSLFTNLASDTPARIRLLAKFVENTYEKTDKVLEIRDSAQARLKEVEKEIESEKKACRASVVGQLGTDRMGFGFRTCSPRAKRLIATQKTCGIYVDSTAASSRYRRLTISSHG